MTLEIGVYDVDPTIHQIILECCPRGVHASLLFGRPDGTELVSNRHYFDPPPGMIRFNCFETNMVHPPYDVLRLYISETYDVFTFLSRDLDRSGIQRLTNLNEEDSVAKIKAFFQQALVDRRPTRIQTNAEETGFFRSLWELFTGGTK